MVGRRTVFCLFTKREVIGNGMTHLVTCFMLIGQLLTSSLTSMLCARPFSFEIGNKCFG